GGLSGGARAFVLRQRLFCPSPQSGCDNEAENHSGQEIFERVVDLAVPLLNPASGQMDLVEPAEHPVEHADMLAVYILGSGSLNDVVADPTIDCGHKPVLHRPFDVAKQDDPISIGRILGSVDESLIEHESLSVAPNAFHAIDQDSASFRIGGYQSEVITQRAGERIAMRTKLAAGRQHCKHCAMDSWN